MFLTRWRCTNFTFHRRSRFKSYQKMCPLDTFHDHWLFKSKEISPGLQGGEPHRFFKCTIFVSQFLSWTLSLSRCMYCDPLHRPGDIVHITGIFLPKAFAGFKVKLLILVLMRFNFEFKLLVTLFWPRLCKRDWWQTRMLKPWLSRNVKQDIQTSQCLLITWVSCVSIVASLIYMAGSHNPSHPKYLGTQI